VEDEFLGGLDEVQDICKQFLEAGLVDPGEEVEEEVLDVFGVGEDVDVADDVGEEGVLVAEADGLLDALVVEDDRQFLEVDVELHVLEQALAELIHEQHHEGFLEVLEHSELAVWLLERQRQQLFEEGLAVVHYFDGRGYAGVSEGEELP